MMSRRSAIGILLLTIFFWSMGGVLIKLMVWQPQATAGYRSLIAGIVLWAIYPRAKFRWSLPQWGGAIAYAVTVVLFVLATTWTTAANAVLLQYSAPIYVALFGSWYLSEVTRPRDWLLLMLALAGMVLFFYDDLTFRHQLGNVLAIISGVSFAWLALFLRAQRHGSNIESIILGNVLAALVCLPWMITVDGDMRAWSIIILLGVVQMALPYILYAAAIKYLRAFEAMMLQLVEPILNPLWVLLIIHEVPGPMAMLGGGVVLGVVALRAFYILQWRNSD